jgi:hypothetical protein
MDDDDVLGGCKDMPGALDLCGTGGVAVGGLGGNVEAVDEGLPDVVDTGLVLLMSSCTLQSIG